MLTNPESRSQPADGCESPPAGADGSDRPSQQLAGLPESAAAIERLPTFFKTKAVVHSASETSQ